jgi:hypothetical protein
MSINSFFNTVSVSRYSRPITVTRDPDKLENIDLAMLLSAVMCVKPLRHRNVNIKLYINQNYSSGIHFAKELNKIYLNNIIKKKLVERAYLGHGSL